MISFLRIDKNVCRIQNDSRRGKEIFGHRFHNLINRQKQFLHVLIPHPRLHIFFIQWLLIQCMIVKEQYCIHHLYMALQKRRNLVASQHTDLIVFKRIPVFVFQHKYVSRTLFSVLCLHCPFLLSHQTCSHQILRPQFCLFENFRYFYSFQRWSRRIFQITTIEYSVCSSSSLKTSVISIPSSAGADASSGSPSPDVPSAAPPARKSSMVLCLFLAESEAENAFLQS